jgi:hypothetical protein
MIRLLLLRLLRLCKLALGLRLVDLLGPEEGSRLLRLLRLLNLRGLPGKSAGGDGE